MKTKRNAVKRWFFKTISSPASVFLLTVVLGSLLLFMYFLKAAEHLKSEQRLIKRLQADQASLELYMNFTKKQTVLTGQNSLNSKRYGGKGIVICAGGNMLLANTYVSVKVLRHHLNCNLPIEIFYNGPREIGPKTRRLLMDFANVTLVDLEKMPFPMNHPKPDLYNGYVQKIFSLYSTNFSQALLLDADCQPVKSPTLLFDSPSFHEKGSMFWSDFWSEGFSESPEEVVYSWTGLTPPWKRSKVWRCAESGQVLLDRQRHDDVLEWLWHLNAHAKLLYRHMLGDKDTFEMAFRLAGKAAAYNRIPNGPGLALSALQDPIFPLNFWHRNFGKRDEHRRYLRLGMLQFDEASEAAFMHRTEHAKFALWTTGYSLDVMKVAYIVPPLTASTATAVRVSAWKMHSIPVGMGDMCCKDYEKQGVCSRHSKSSAQGLIHKLPLVSIGSYSQPLLEALEAGMQAYKHLESTLGNGLKLKFSP